MDSCVLAWRLWPSNSGSTAPEAYIGPPPLHSLTHNNSRRPITLSMDPSRIPNNVPSISISTATDDYLLSR